MTPFHVQMVVEAQSPIAHHEGNDGNHASFMRRKIRMADGSFGRVPIVTADTMRNLMRRLTAEYMLQAAGLLSADRGPDLTESALRLLMAGGMLTGKGDGSTIKLEHWRELTRLIPSLAMLGGCADAMVIPGKIEVEDMMPICQEAAHLLPRWALHFVANHPLPDDPGARGCAEDVLRCLPSFREQMEVQQRVRMDPVTNPTNRLLLSGEAQARVEGRLLAREAAHEDDDAVAAAGVKSAMLPRTYETLAQGSYFSLEITGRFDDAMDEATFYTMLALMRTSKARIGGKKGTGNGRIRVEKVWHARMPQLREKVEDTDMNALGESHGKVFLKTVEQNKDAIRKLLSEVDA